MAIQKILLVDDSKTELHHMSELLGKRGFMVRTAANADEALRRLGEDTPDLILMDVVMPELNGFQATRKLSRDDETKDIPVIIVSTKDQETDRIWGMRQGAKGYLVKPPTREDLLETISEFV